MPTPKKTQTKKTAGRKPISKKFSLNRKNLVIVGSILIVMILVFLSRGWVRHTAIPSSAGIFYLNGVENNLNNEVSSLQNPFKALGYTKVYRSPSLCSLEIAQSIHTEIDCNAEVHAYTKTPTDAEGRQNLEEQAKNIQAMLLKDGWSGGGNGVTLTSLVDGTYRGIDYSPDAFYEKVTGSNDCVFDTMIAYANPQPPAINSTFSCDRTVNILGTPWGEFYNSSKGHV